MLKGTLTIIIVNYNSTDLLLNCLHSIFFTQNELTLQVIVVDNNSSDKSKEKVKIWFPQVFFLQNDKNVGFSRACNQGLQVAQGRYVLFLNPDTIIKNNVFTKCLKYLEAHTDAGLLGCKLINADGSLQPSCADFPYIHKLILGHIVRWKIFPNKIKEKFLLKYWKHNKIREVDWVLGAFMMARIDLLKQIGGFNESFFLYGEDLDLCYRLQGEGWKIIFFPHAEILHFGNPTWDNSRLALVYNALFTFYSEHFSKTKTRLFRLFMLAFFYQRNYRGL